MDLVCPTQKQANNFYSVQREEVSYEGLGGHRPDRESHPKLF